MRQFFCALIVIITLYSCNKEIESDYPLIFTGDVVNIKDTTATFTAKGKTKSDVLHLSQEKNHNAS